MCVCACVAGVFVLRNGGVTEGEGGGGGGGEWRRGKDWSVAVRESVLVDYRRVTTLATTLDLFLRTPNRH